MGMTMSSSSFRRGVGDTVVPAIGEVREKERSGKRDNEEENDAMKVGGE